MDEMKIKMNLWKDVFMSPTRMGLFVIVSNKENKNMTISSIHNGYCENFKKQDYKNTYKHLKKLEADGFISIKKDKHKQGSPSIVKFISPVAFGLFYQFLEANKESLHEYVGGLSEKQLNGIIKNE